MRSPRTILWTIAALASMLPNCVLAADFSISSTSTNTTFSSVSDGQPQTASGTGPVSTRADGTMASMCTPYGRFSTASADAGVSYSDQSADGMFVELRASAFAAGGHYRTCGFCGPNDQCVLIDGHDTTARSEGGAVSVTKIEFSQELNHSAYTIAVAATGATSELSIGLKAPDGTTTSVDSSHAAALNVEPKEGDVYFLTVGTHVAASNAGGCCESRAEHSSAVKVSVTPHAIIASEEPLDPYILGGTPVADGLYDSVVGILLDGRIHCSGVVVGKRTVLTAAHCIDGYETAIAEGKVQLFLGNSVFEHGALKQVVDAAFPKGEMGIQYKRTRNSIQHDIGLMYTAADIGAPNAALHKLDPTWSDIKKSYSAELTFVGFGLKVMKGGKGSGAGVKREATWRYSDLDTFNFYFKGQASNTCSGDSGGPAFLREQKSGDLILVGITSAGDQNCTRGIEMRVDAHNQWIDSRLQ
ncbi:trypsin-like serine protease [Mesorhizobium sp. C120A]|uniref:trypsin-like serine protease n=1 Tax=unclassified Mesorhizobium TaxID=325217 RepID=UPI0003D0322A|nr:MULTISPECIES: trypsin-like serine protease [unclassified Mesorhizobium]ESZ54551.1 hypothetical protein X728_31445 [Mesorhizobium sp. L103C120A0]WJI47241.1 trypsin-like serine protease [Mesorhizobium sp. C120A]